MIRLILGEHQRKPMAIENTRQPMYVRHVQTCVRRMNNADEAVRLMGYDAEDGSSISTGCGEVSLTEEEKKRLIGKAICF